MNFITLVSQITPADLAEYLRLTEVTGDDENTLSTMLGIAKAYISGYTGLSNLDEYQDLVIAVFVLVQDMWDNRVLYVDKPNLNRVVETILNMHQRNLL